MLPTIICPYLLSRDQASIKDAIVDAATHAQTPAPLPAAAGAGPMEDSFIQEVDQHSVAAPVAAKLLAIAQQRLTSTPARPACTNTPATAGPRRGCLYNAEQQRHSYGGLCMYCGTHPARTRCSKADEAKRACIAAAKVKHQ
jgi:hypothetical protein